MIRNISSDLALLLRAGPVSVLSRREETYIYIFSMWRRQQTSTNMFFIPTLYSEAILNTRVRIINHT